MEIVWAAVSFLGVLILVGIIFLLATAGSRSTSVRLEKLTSPAPRPIAPPGRPGARDSMPTISALLSGRELTERLYLQLSSAGLRMRPSEFVGITAGSFIFSQIIGLALGGHVLLSIGLAVLGIGIPIAVLKFLQGKRQRAFDAQLVDALMMIASSLRSGFSFLRGMQIVAQEMPAPVSEEFERVINEVGVGRTMEDSLRNMVARMQSYDLDLAVTAILIQLQVGGNLSEMLETIAATIRERVRIFGEMRALTAEGRLSGWVLVAIPIILGFALTVINPLYMSFLFKETLGHYLIGAAVFLQIIGGLVIKRMLVLDA